MEDKYGWVKTKPALEAFIVKSSENMENLYCEFMVLQSVCVNIGLIDPINTKTIEGLSCKNVSYLDNLSHIINKNAELTAEIQGLVKTLQKL